MEYRDADGNKCSLSKLVRTEPEWAANVINGYVKKLERIAGIIETVDNRCMATDGPVTATLDEMDQSEISEIYKLATDRKK